MMNENHAVEGVKKVWRDIFTDGPFSLRPGDYVEIHRRFHSIRGLENCSAPRRG